MVELMKSGKPLTPENLAEYELKLATTVIEKEDINKGWRGNTNSATHRRKNKVNRKHNKIAAQSRKRNWK